MSQYAPFLLPLALLYGYLLAASLAVMALRPLVGSRFGRLLAVPLVGALGLAVILFAVAPGESLDLVPLLLRGGLVAGGIYGLDPIWTLPLAIAALVAAIVTAHYAIEVLPALARWIVGRTRPVAASGLVSDVTRVVTLLLVGAAVIGSSIYLRSALAPTGEGLLRIVRSFDLDGSPTSIAMTDADSGYMAFGEGSIVRFELPANGSDLEIHEVATGLSFPRGLAVADGRLFVIDLGDLPCANPFPQCWFAEPSRELEVLNATSGSVISYEINPDGSLGASSTVLENLPVVSTEHAPNDIEVGRDGMLYLSIGNVDRLPLDPSLLSRVDRPHQDLLGTIVRFGPDGGDVGVWTRGIRNIYELATDPDGNTYGVDNDGPAMRGWRAEALIELREGADWGFPRYGTYDANLPAAARPIWTLHLSGSAGLSWVDGVDGRSGLLIGGLGTIEFVGVERDSQGPMVIDELDVGVAVDGLQGFVPSIETLSDGRVLAAVFAPFSGYRNTLLLLAPQP